MSAAASTSTVAFESFPSCFDDSDSDDSTIASKLKRFFVGAPSSSASSTVLPAPPPPLQPPQVDPPPAPIPVLISAEPSSKPSTQSRQHSRNLSASRQQLAQLASGLPPRPIPFPSASTVQPSPSYPVLPNGRQHVRPIRLSGVAPSVRLTVANSEKGDLIQSASSRTITSEYRFGGDGFGQGGVHGSPTASESFGATLANLSSIPGFPLGRDAGDDNRSVKSMSTVVRPSASVAHVFRKLRGEVRAWFSWS
jgi:1-phosphatidylinositol-3-phosphate 5-kinase